MTDEAGRFYEQFLRMDRQMVFEWAKDQCG